MENNWYGQFDFDQVQDLREDARDNPLTRANIREVTGNDLTLTDYIINGPDEDMLKAIQSDPENEQIRKSFDDIWGRGAAEYYADPNYSPNEVTFLDHIIDIPGAAVRGVAGAAAEFGQGVFNTRGEADVEAREAQQAYADYVAEKRGVDRSDIPVPEQEVADYDRKQWNADTILNGYIEAPESLTGQLVEGGVQFLAPFAVGLGATGKLTTLMNAGKAGKGAAAIITGFGVDYAAFDPNDPLITTVIADATGIESQIIDDYFRHQGDDSDVEKRLRRAIEGAVIGEAVGVVLYGVTRVVKGLRSKKITPEQASEEIETLLRSVEQEHIAGPTAVEREKGPEAATDGSESPLWHLSQRDTQSTTKAAQEGAEEVSEDTVSSYGSNLEQAEAAVTNAKPKSTVTPAMHRRAILKATRLYEAARKAIVDDPWQEAVDLLRGETDVLAEAGMRTRTQIGEAIAPVVQRVRALVASGDVAGLRAFATEADDMIGIRVRSAAVQAVTRSVRLHTDHLAKMYETALESASMSAHDKTVMREVLHKQVQFAMEVESLNANLGSAAGALLGQRAAHMNPIQEMIKAIKDATEAAKAAGKSKRQTKKEIKQAVQEQFEKLTKESKGELGKNDSKLMVDRYRELTSQGVEPEVAYMRVKTMADEARRRGIHLTPEHNGKKKMTAAEMKKALEEESKWDKTLRGLEQWRYNAMLSGLKTHQTNFLSSMANMTSRIAYEAVFGNEEIRKAASRKVVGMVTGMKESLLYAVESWKQMKPILDEVTSFERLEPAYGKGSGAVAQVLTYATRMMLATDQFVKQLAYRGEIRASAEFDADLAKLTGKEREAFINKRIESAFTENGVGTDMLAVERANDVTFMKEFDSNSKYLGERAMAWATQQTSQHYIARWLFPFMRIFFRLTNEGIRMTPGVRDGIALASKGVNLARGVEGSSKYMDDLMGHNGKVAQARAVGEFAVGYAITGWTVAMVAEGNITGGEPMNWVDANMESHVVKPYHIRIGDKWYDYQRFEPFAFPMKFWANSLLRLKDVDAAADRGEYLRQQEEMQAQIGAFSFALGQAVTNNSFMDGIENLAKIVGGNNEPLDAAGRWAQGQLDSYVPNLFRKINQSLEDEQYSANTMLEGLRKHFSAFHDTSDIDLRRNMFTGEPIALTPEKKWDGHFLFVGKPEGQEKAMKLLVEANEHTGMQFQLTSSGGFNLGQGIDLKNVEQDDGGRSLYDQYLQVFSETKIGGKTYTEQLEALYDDPDFQALPWGNTRWAKGTKAETISKIKSEYEKAAKDWMSRNSKSYLQLQLEQAQREGDQAEAENRAAMQRIQQKGQSTAAEILELD